MLNQLRKTFAALALGLVLFGWACAPQVYATDISITAGNVAPDAGYQYLDTTAGATITAGQVCYIDTSNTAQKAITTSAITAAARGIALNGASSGQPLRLMTAGTITIGGTSVVGKIYIVSATAGGVAPVTDTATTQFVTVIGIGVSATKIAININASGVAVP